MRCWKPGSRLVGPGFSGDGFLAMPSDHLCGVERDEPKAQALLVLDVAGCHARQRHHDDTSMDGLVRYTFYQRAYQEQEGPVKLRSPLLVRAGSPDPPVPWRPSAGREAWFGDD